MIFTTGVAEYLERKRCRPQRLDPQLQSTQSRISNNKINAAALNEPKKQMGNRTNLKDYVFEYYLFGFHMDFNGFHRSSRDLNIFTRFQ